MYSGINFSKNLNLLVIVNLLNSNSNSKRDETFINLQHQTVRKIKIIEREIDEDRVGEIKKYLENNDDVKFFNPLTLVVLPMNENKTQVIKETTFLSEGIEKIGNQSQGYKLYTRENFFKINIDSNNDFGRIAWNDERCNIAAIDGQHRLSALKRMHQEGNLDNFKWKIPIVLLTI